MSKPLDLQTIKKLLQQDIWGGVFPPTPEKVEQMIEVIEKMRKALKEILLGKGKYSKDHLTHASNCIEHMKDTAKQALSLVKP